MSADGNYHAVLNAHGLYNSEQFVLRLSPKNHRLVAEVEVSGIAGGSFSPELYRAYSTYLHETIHWWQHVGSTAGVVLSLCYPNQTHGNITFLSDWASQVKPSKSVKSWAMQGELAGRTHSDQAQANANTIVNNAMDLDFYKRWLMQPGLENEIYHDPHFESQGHCFRMAYSTLINNLSPGVDPNFSTLPDPRVWEESFRDMSSRKVFGYFYGSPMMRRRVGVIELFEGQACFSQMQFLAGSLGTKDIDGFRRAGMLHGVYETAFLQFLETTEFDEPDDVNDSIVGLFLMICDLSINPAEGFPCEITDFENFVHHADPGIRFEILCSAVAASKDQYSQCFKFYDKSEYDSVSLELMHDAGLMHPVKAWEKVASWLDKNGDFKQLLDEKGRLKFQPTNMVQRVILSHFMSMAVDRLEHPEFFCWPGFWKSTGGGEDWCRAMWLKNLSLFTDQEDNRGIFIRKFPGVEPENLVETLNMFFGNNLFYNLTRQWIIEDGSFSYGFRWLSEEFGEPEFRGAADRLFHSQFGVSTSDIQF